MTATATSVRKAQVSQQDIEIARVYAEAALGLADERGLADRLLEETGGLVEVLDESPELENILSSPLVDVEERGVAMDKIFQGRIDDTLLDTLQVMNRKGRSGLVRALAEAYRQEYNKLKGMVEAGVSTAVPMTDDMKQRLEEEVSRITGKTALLTERIDESLIGGMVLHVGDARMDTSVVKEIREMERKLMDRASRETNAGGGWTADD